MIGAANARDLPAVDSLATVLLAKAAPRSPSRMVALAYRAQLYQIRGQIARAMDAYRNERDEGLAEGLTRLPLEVDLVPAFVAMIMRGDSLTAWPMVLSALARHPLDSLAAQDRPFAGLAELAALAGQLAAVHRFRASWEAGTRPDQRDSNAIHEWDGAEAAAARRWDAAATALGRAYAGSHCSPCGGYLFAYALDHAGRTDSAAAVYQSIVNGAHNDSEDTFDDYAWYAVTLDKLGRYYQARGDRERAVGYLSRFTVLWANADPDLQPRVRDARARVAELVGEKK